MSRYIYELPDWPKFRWDQTVRWPRRWRQCAIGKDA